jgi:hypothetical protein
MEELMESDSAVQAVDAVRSALGSNKLIILVSVRSAPCKYESSFDIF